jgi:DNA-binding ferritin-like protein (Dps family)
LQPQYNSYLKIATQNGSDFKKDMLSMTQIQKNLPEDLDTMQARIQEYCAAWTTRAGQPNWSTIETLYAAEDLFHYDAVTPHSFANVAGMKQAFAEMQEKLQLQSLTLTMRDDLQTFRRGDLVWTTVLQDIVAARENGNPLKMVQRNRDLGRTK